MSKELQKLIREAFSMAYNQHKSKKLNENSEKLKALISPADIIAVEKAYIEIKGNIELSAVYAWTPQGSANGKLNQKQFNLLIEMLFEGTDMDEKGKIFMTIYGDKNPALINTIGARLTGLKGTNVTRKEAFQAAEVAWNEMFLGELTKSGERLKKGFSDAVSQYNSKDNKSGTQSNFGAFLLQRLISSASNALRDETSLERPVSLDAPFSNGKSRDIGDNGAEDFGSDTLNTPDAEDTMRDFGGAFDSPEGDSQNNIELPGDSESEEDLDVEYNGETLSNSIEDSMADEETPASKNAKEMISILLESLTEAINDFRQYTNVTPSQEKGLSALENVIKSGESPAKEDGNSIIDLKKNKKFINTIDRYLLENGFLNSRGRAASFEGIKTMHLARMVKFLKTGDLSLLKDLQENKIWFIDELVMEKFIRKNMSQIMENVYNRLSKNL